MRIFMGVVVAAMGAVIFHHTPMGFVQILLGAVLVWLGVQKEIRKAANQPAPPPAPPKPK